MASDRMLKQYSTGLAASPSTTLGWATRSMRRRPTRPAGAPAYPCPTEAACCKVQLISVFLRITLGWAMRSMRCRLMRSLCGITRPAGAPAPACPLGAACHVVQFS